MRISDWSSDVCSSDLMSLDVTLGEGAHFELGGAILGHGSQTLEIVTTVRHDRPNASSKQTIRSVLGQTAPGSFLGAIKVARHAQKTDAEQSVKAIDRKRDG